jgi:hypothetical protein
MKDLSTTLKKAFLVFGLMMVAILACTPANAGEDGTTSSLGGKDFYSRANMSKDYPENGSVAPKLIIPLSPLFSLDLGLSSVDTGQSPPGEKQPGTPPIPILKAPSDLRYGRLGVGLSFGF